MKPPATLPGEVLKAFAMMPDPYVIVSPELVILTASEAYLKATHTLPDAIMGKHLSEVFSGKAITQENPFLLNLKASLRQVLRTKKPHQMATESYQVLQTAGAGGRLNKSYWNLLNTPVLDEQGEVEYLILKFEEVTQGVSQAQQIADLKQAVLSQQQKSEQILNTLDVAFIQLDANYHFVYLNPKAEAFLGVSHKRLFNTSIWEFLPQEIGSEGYNAIITASQFKVLAEAEYFSNINHNWTFLSAMPFEGGVLLLIYNRQDIRVAQQQLREREMLREAEAIGQMGSYEVDIATMQINFSDNMFRLLGKEPQSFVPTLDQIDAISEPEDASNVRQVLEEAINKKQPYWYLRRVFWPDGQLRYLSSHGKVISDPEGNAVKILGTVHDITDQKRAEAEIQEQANFIKQITDAVPGAIHVYDLVQEQMVYINREPNTQCGDREQEFEEMSSLDWIDQIVHPEDRSALWQHIKNLSQADDDRVRSLNYRIVNKAGEMEWRRIRAKVFKRDAAGNPIQYISLIQNITEIKQLEQENLDLRLHQQKALILAILEAQEEDRRRISESLHNGLGQILYAAKLNLDQVAQLVPKQGRAENPILQTTQNLIQEAIKETRKVSHELVPVLLKDFGIEEALRDLCCKFSKSALHLSCKAEKIEGRLASYLEVALYRISQELVNNIVKHSGATAASIQLSQQENKIMLQVRDNGQGFSPETGKTKGIGLRTIADRVKLLNGALAITAPKNGKGTVVTIRIPTKA